MIVVYIGSFDEVEFYEFNGQLDRRAVRGEPIDVADATALGSESESGLLAQADNWRTATEDESAAYRAAQEAAVSVDESAPDSSPPVLAADPAAVAPTTDEPPAVDSSEPWSNA